MKMAQEQQPEEGQELQPELQYEPQPTQSRQPLSRRQIGLGALAGAVITLIGISSYRGCESNMPVTTTLPTATATQVSTSTEQPAYIADINKKIASLPELSKQLAQVSRDLGARVQNLEKSVAQASTWQRYGDGFIDRSYGDLIKIEGAEDIKVGLYKVPDGKGGWKNDAVVLLPVASYNRCKNGNIQTNEDGSPRHETFREYDKFMKDAKKARRDFIKSQW